MQEEEKVLKTRNMSEILPHSAPFLFVDRIVELEKGKRAVGIKNVSINEDYFRGHFPGQPVMPGVLILEAMAQVGGIAVILGTGQEDSLFFLARIEKARFFKPVLPGDCLRIEIEVLKYKQGVGKVKGLALVEGETVAESILYFSRQRA